MIRPGTASVSHLFQLSHEEAVTLRRLAGGEADPGALPRADMERLLQLRLIADTRSGIKLTVSGQEHFDSLPRAPLAGKPPGRVALKR